MKSYHATVVFLFFLTLALISGISSYNKTAVDIVNDMNNALELTLAEQKAGVITPDTVENYRQNLKIEELRGQSFVYFATNDNKHQFSSRRMAWRTNKNIKFQSYALVSTASVIGMSDQRLSISLSAISVAWLLFSFWYMRRTKPLGFVYGNITFNENEQLFYNIDHEEIFLTPMQKELMTMFWQASDHTLTKKAISESLWPKKPDASETLYTLVKRLRETLKASSRLNIISDNNGRYQLKENTEL